MADEEFGSPAPEMPQMPERPGMAEIPERSRSGRGLERHSSGHGGMQRNASGRGMQRMSSGRGMQRMSSMRPGTKGAPSARPGMMKSYSQMLPVKKKKNEMKVGRAQLKRLDSQRSGMSSGSGSQSGRPKSVRKGSKRGGTRPAKKDSTTSKLKGTQRSDAMRQKGIKHGITGLNKADLESLEELDIDVFWVEEEKEIENIHLRRLNKILIWLKCLPESRKDFTFVKNSLRWMQWVALLADLTCALASIIQFSGATKCCEKDILDNLIKVNFPWDIVIRVLTWVYLLLVVLEIYPVVGMGYHFNFINPFFGFIITVAMFFDDDKSEALIMWTLETFAVVCEFIIFRLKATQQIQRAKDVKTVGRLTRRTKYDDEDPEDHAKHLKEARQRYYQLKQEQLSEDKVLWFLRLAIYINILLSLFLLSLVITISQAGGLCADSGKALNPFVMNQRARCSDSLEFGTGENHEVCRENGSYQCYFPYG